MKEDALQTADIASIEVTKDTTPSRFDYVAKIPKTITDDFGNEVTVYSKENLSEPVLLALKVRKEKELEEINYKLDAIAQIKIAEGKK